MNQSDQDSIQQQIIQELRVNPDLDVSAAIKQRTLFLSELLQKTGAKTLVLGVSGGVDSLLAGCLAQQAVIHARSLGVQASCIAVRLPYGNQIDAADAMASLDVIKPDENLEINIKSGADGLLDALLASGHVFRSPAQRDFIHGNIKARQRMVALYAVAGSRSGLVVGTDQAAETLMGFSTKYGDNAADVMPLMGLTKSQVRSMAGAMGAPDHLVNKIPTADLESLNPQKPDEDSLGVTYQQIDDFLTGKTVDLTAYKTIINAWQKSLHKRSLPAEPER